MENLIGKKFGKWTVIGPESYDNNNNKKILCRCRCGQERQILVYNLKKGFSTMCQACSYKDRTKSIVGLKFSRYTVLEDTGRDKSGNFLVKCMCDCGAIRIVQKASLTSGGSTQCYRCAYVVHNMSGTPIYRVRASMFECCYNKKNINYNRFGGLGITVCDRWRHSFENFYADMGDRPKGLQLGRIDKDGNYGPDNCRWVTPRENSNNHRSFKSKQKAKE